MFFKRTKVYNKRPRNFGNGGFVQQRKNMSYRQIHHDSIKAILMPNELVIPVKYAPLVTHFLKSKNIKLPNM
jgi:hypothetical protein